MIVKEQAWILLPFFADVGSIEGLAYDPVYNELYWTSFTNSSISRIRVDTDTDSPQKIVQLGPADHPRAIVINICEMYVRFYNKTLSSNHQHHKNYTEIVNLTLIFLFPIIIQNNVFYYLSKMYSNVKCKCKS